MTTVHDGASMRAARHRLGMSVTDLGLALGLGNGCARRAGRAVRKYEADDPRRPVSPAIAAAIADLELGQDDNGHRWVIGRLQADDERECSRCRCDSDDTAAQAACPGRLAP